MPFIQRKFPSGEHSTLGRPHDPPGGEQNALRREFTFTKTLSQDQFQHFCLMLAMNDYI